MEKDKETPQPKVVPDVIHGQSIREFVGKKVWYDECGAGYIWGNTEKDGDQMLAQIRGWGAIQNVFKNEADIKMAEDFQDALGSWIADAIQQKLDRQ